MSAKSLYFVLSKKQFGSTKSGALKEYFVITLIQCDNKQLTGAKSYDKFVEKEIYEKVRDGFVFEMEFSIDGKLESVDFDNPLGVVAVKLDHDVLVKMEDEREQEYDAN